MGAEQTGEHTDSWDGREEAPTGQGLVFPAGLKSHCDPSARITEVVPLRGASVLCVQEGGQALCCETGKRGVHHRLGSARGPGLPRAAHLLLQWFPQGLSQDKRQCPAGAQPGQGLDGTERMPSARAQARLEPRNA